MSIEKIHLRKLLQLFYADPKLERKLLLEDIRADIAKAKKKKEKKEGKKPKEGGDFYGAFWSDVKDHAAGISDITEETDKRIADNEMRGRLYPILRDSFLFMWNDMMRWRNERFEFVPKSVHAQLPTNELGAVVKIENTVAVKIWDESHRIIYPYFSEHPTLSEDAARLGFWALREALPDYQAADFRIVDIQHRKYFRPDEVGTTGDEKEQFTQKYAVLLRKWRDLKAGR